MASASPPSPPSPDTSSSAEDPAVKAVKKRYEGLVTVRTKANKGKGAWYWTHLEPVLVRNPDTNLPKAVKLKCSLCDALFSASNPSRTASEHLKRGTCPSFSAHLRPTSSFSPPPISSSMAFPPAPAHNQKKRSLQVGISYSSRSQVNSGTFNDNNSLAIVGSTRVVGDSNNSNARLTPQHLVLSGGKEDLGALAMLENSVKKLKSPKTSPGPALSKEQIDSALDFLADWFYESSGSVSFSVLNHPKFRAFLNQVGMPLVSRRDVLGGRLDAKFFEAKKDSDERIRNAMFFQLSSDGWKSKCCCCSCSCRGCAKDNLVKFCVNLPNGTSVYQKSVYTGGSVSSKYAEEILGETAMEITGSSLQRCVGLVADKYKAKALRDLEIQNQWMVNLSCQLQGFLSLMKDFNKELPLFWNVTENCLKLANFINNTAQISSSFQKCRMQELGCGGLIQVPSNKCDCSKNILTAFAMLEDILSSSHALRMVLLDTSYKSICMEDPTAHEVAQMIKSEGFWNELEAVYSLVNLIRGMAQEIEAERPLIGQCLPLWEQLKVKVKEWCGRFNIAEGAVGKIVENRFRKNYHPAWSAAFVLDPVYLVRDSSGKYLPPFKCLTQEQEKDVDRLITRLATREEAHAALKELMKWRSEGLDPLYAQAVQVKQQDPVTGKMRIANPQSRRLVWETCLSDHKLLGKIAVKLIFLHATSCGLKCNWSFMKQLCVHGPTRASLEKAQKVIFVAAHSKLERRDFSNEEDKDAELFITAGSEDDMLNQVFEDAT